MSTDFDPRRLRAELIAACLSAESTHHYRRIAGHIAGRHEREASRWSRCAADTVDRIRAELDLARPTMRETMAYELRRRDRDAIRDGIGFLAAAIGGDTRRAAETAHGRIRLRRELDGLTPPQPEVGDLATD